MFIRWQARSIILQKGFVMVMKCNVRTVGDALAYVTDCNLATVCDMASKKSRNKHEFNRQISIAKTAIDWMIEMGVDFSTTRAEDVVLAGSVELWAAKFISPQPSLTQTESYNHKEKK
jgi:hypothetical protein